MISLIAAVSKNNVIGRDGKIPWHLSADLKRFKALTMGHPVIMGRKTYESLGKPLPGRTNIVLSRSGDFNPQGSTVAKSLKEALHIAQGNEEIFVIGGQSVYEEALPLADRIYLTRVDLEIEGDAFFPEFKEHEWRIVSQEIHEKDTENPLGYTYLIYEMTK